MSERKLVRTKHVDRQVGKQPRKIHARTVNGELFQSLQNKTQTILFSLTFLLYFFSPCNPYTCTPRDGREKGSRKRQDIGKLRTGVKTTDTSHDIVNP